MFGLPESRGCARLPRPFRLLPWRLPVVVAAVVVVTVTTVAARTRTGARASQRAHDVERRAVSQPIHSRGQHRRHLALPAERESRPPVSSVVSLSSLLYFPFSLSLSSVLLLRPVVTPPPLVAVVFRSAVTVLRQSSNLFFLVSSALHVHSPERTFRFTSADRVSDPNLAPSFDRGGEPELSRVSESQRRSVCQMSRGCITRYSPFPGNSRAALTSGAYRKTYKTRVSAIFPLVP